MFPSSLSSDPCFCVFVLSCFPSYKVSWRCLFCLSRFLYLPHWKRFPIPTIFSFLSLSLSQGRPARIQAETLGAGSRELHCPKLPSWGWLRQVNYNFPGHREIHRQEVLEGRDKLTEGMGTEKDHETSIFPSNIRFADSLMNSKSCWLYLSV